MTETNDAETMNLKKTEIKVLDRVGDYFILEIPLWDFESLNLNEKIILYYLWHAGVSGDRITYQQNNRHSLELRDFFLDLIQYEKEIKKFDKNLHEKILSYTKRIVIHHGNHNSDSTIKFMPDFNAKEFSALLKDIPKFNHKLTPELTKAIFDKNYESMITNKNPKIGDIITESKNTFYENVAQKDLENFEDKYPLNSTLVKTKDGKLIEKVWRSGTKDGKILPGLYSKELSNVVNNLREAIKYADKSYGKVLSLLADFFETGDPKKYDEYNIEWLKVDPKIDTILGFVETYMDARGSKGTFEGAIFFRDEKSNALIKSIANNSQHLEDNAPWDAKYKKKWASIPTANAFMQIMATGGAGPVCFAGVNLPNEQWIREKYGSKNFYISNTTYASRTCFADRLFKEFLDSDEDIKLMAESFKARGPIMVTLHEVVGHGSGKVNPKLKGDPKDHLLEYYSTLEEARAELCALYHVWNKKLIKDGVITETDAKAACLDYVFSYLTQMRRYPGEDMIHEDHERARSLIVLYLIEKGSCSLYKKNGKTYPKVNDYALMNKQVGDLLSEIMRIKGEGDYLAGKKLVEKYGIYFDLALRDEVVARVKKIDYPKRYAYVMYKSELVTDGKTGKIVDVKIRPYSSILEQAQDIRKLYG
ncbi:MAG TPA: hypothetical protein VEC16_01120 [Alphaproteobacteria bacterium]|nr:hypothetical protein [Alphaproteobacteria bacterium]